MEMFSVYKGLLVTCVINNLDGLDPLDIDHQCSWIHVCWSLVFHHLNYCHQRCPWPHQSLVHLSCHQTYILKTHPKDQHTNDNGYLGGIHILRKHIIWHFLEPFWTRCNFFELNCTTPSLPPTAVQRSYN